MYHTFIIMLRVCVCVCVVSVLIKNERKIKSYLVNQSNWSNQSHRVWLLPLLYRHSSTLLHLLRFPLLCLWFFIWIRFWWCAIFSVIRYELWYEVIQFIKMKQYHHRRKRNENEKKNYVNVNEWEDHMCKIKVAS